MFSFFLNFGSIIKSSPGVDLINLFSLWGLFGSNDFNQKEN
jgi:hypothetical protein